MNYYEIDSDYLADCPRTVKTVEEACLVVDAWFVKEITHWFRAFVKHLLMKQFFKRLEAKV